MAANKRFEPIGLVQASRCGYKQKLPLLFCFVFWRRPDRAAGSESCAGYKIRFEVGLAFEGIRLFHETAAASFDGISATLNAGAIRCSCVSC